MDVYDPHMYILPNTDSKTLISHKIFCSINTHIQTKIFILYVASILLRFQFEMIFKDFIKTFDIPFIIHMFSMDTLFIRYILVLQKAYCTCVKVFFQKRSFQGCKYTFLFYFCLFNETNNEKTSPNICKVNLISCKTVSLRKRIFVKETKTKRGSKQRLQNT